MKKRISLAAGLVAALSSCATISPSGLIALSRLDPLETAPSDLSVAVSVPAELILNDGDASLLLAFAPADPSVAEEVSANVPLAIWTNSAGPAPAEGRQVYVFGFDPKEAAQLAEAQRQIKALQAANVDGHGTLSVNVEGGCFVGAVAKELPVATWIRTDPASGFVQLTREADLIAVLNETERAELEAELRLCDPNP